MSDEAVAEHPADDDPATGGSDPGETEEQPIYTPVDYGLTSHRPRQRPANPRLTPDRRCCPTIRGGQVRSLIPQRDVRS